MAHMGDITVGIPRALAYYMYYPMWKSFFETLGVKVVVSPETTEQILNDGVLYTVTDACVPIKVFHGHVVALKDKVDYLFIPRLVNVSRQVVFCPKFLGLSDMVKASIDNLPPIIDVRIDLRKGKLELWRVCRRIGRIFRANVWRIYSAYRLALDAFRRFNVLLQEGRTSSDAMDILENGENSQKKEESYELTVALVGYPYEIYDRFISCDVVKKLQDLNVKVVTVDMLPDSVFESSPKIVTKELFWFFSDRAVKGGVHFLNDEQIDGVIHITAFSCGPDFMVNKLLELEAKAGRIPFMTLMIDEQTGDAGVRTRIEAFVDMIKRRKSLRELNTEVAVNGESDIPLHGNISHSC